MQTLEEHLAMHWQVKGGGNKTWISVFYVRDYIVYIWWLQWYENCIWGLIWSKWTNIIFEEGGKGFLVTMEEYMTQSIPSTILYHQRTMNIYV